MCVLDEADALSQDAQSALRRVMEIHTRTTRFCLLCNYSSRIIEPIASRCSKFRFKSLAGEDAGGRLIDIAARENVTYENGVIERLLEVSEGDMRRAVTYLQSSYNLTSATADVAAKSSRARRIITDDPDEEMTDAVTTTTTAPSALVTIRTVEEVAGVIPTAVVEALASAIQTPLKRGGGTAYEAVSKQIVDMVADGWSANQVLSQLYVMMVADETLESGKKSRMLAVFSEIDKRLVDGADEELSIMDLSLRLAGIVRGVK
jgi:replication factor C subunit 2/4